MKSFSELTSASYVSNSDILAISQENSGTYSSKKTTVKEVSDFANQNFAEEYDSTSSYAIGDYCIYESVLYKCIGTTTGAFDSTKWTTVVVTDEMGQGGGGTGGHTIIDENGNSMTARSGLQFFGAVEVTDDSANNRTLVEVLGGDFYNPVIYSTTEREIGVWVDGKPLYCITFDKHTNPVTVNQQTWTAFDTFSTAIKIIKAFALATSNGTITSAYSVNANYENGDVRIMQMRNTPDAFGYVTIYYTKDSDTAGSGTWTPQGVPTEHYSTDEQIIGTYFGDTLYQKTIVLTSGVTIADSWTTIYTDALIGNIAQLVDGKYNNVENKGVYGVLNFKPNGNNLQAVYPISGGLSVFAGARFTLKYTKSS